jgi:hypothetical protein
MDVEMDGAWWQSGPLLVRRQLGRQLRGLRQRARKTHGDVELAGLGHRSTVWRIEAGRGKANPATVRALCWLYGADEATTETLYAMSRRGQQPGWWEEYNGHVPSWFTLYLGLEAEARALSIYQPSVVHGLLQTPEYATAMLSAGAQSSADVERQVRLRLDRQRAVFEREDPLRLNLVLGEGALRCAIGGPEVLGAQLDHLRTVDRLQQVDVRVLPFAAGWHPALRGEFTVLDIPDPADPDVVYIEALDGSRYLETGADLEYFRGIFASVHQRSVPLEEFGWPVGGRTLRGSRRAAPLRAGHAWSCDVTVVRSRCGTARTPPVLSSASLSRSWRPGWTAPSGPSSTTCSTADQQACGPRFWPPQRWTTGRAARVDDRAGGPGATGWAARRKLTTTIVGSLSVLLVVGALAPFIPTCLLVGSGEGACRRVDG